MKTVLIAVALILAACSGGSGEKKAEAPIAHIAVLGEDGNIATYDPATGVTTPITSDAGPGRLYSQPTWSPDGTRLAFVTTGAAVAGRSLQASGRSVLVALEAQQETTGAVYIVPAGGGEPVIITTPFPPFYIYWSPDGTKLAFLGNDVSNSRQGFGMIDTVTRSVDRIDSGQPYFFAWSPASDRLLVHAANRDLYYLSLDGDQEALAATPGSFSAPGWIGDTQLFPVLEGRRQILRLFDPDGTNRRDATDFGSVIALGLNPDEERVAYIDIVAGANLFGLGALTVDTGDGATELAELAAAFFWSADGAKLLYLTPDTADGEFGLRWNVWDGATTIEFERFLPTTTFFQQYLPFFGQYANSLSFWSPDGSSFTFAGTIEGRGDGIWVQPVTGDAPARLVGPGEFSTWAP